MAGHPDLMQALPLHLDAYPDVATAADDLARDAAAALADALARRERALLVAPGGSTPEPFLRRLATHALSWSRIDVVATDERWVPPTDERANERLLRETLPVGGDAGARLVSLLSPAVTAAAGAEAADAHVRSLLGAAPEPDVCVVGMGADLHTASLFPGAEGVSAALDPAGARLVHAVTPGDGGVPRLTLALPVLARARMLRVLITGHSKRAALADAGSRPTHRAPVMALARAAAKPPGVVWAP